MTFFLRNSTGITVSVEIVFECLGTISQGNHEPSSTLRENRPVWRRHLKSDQLFWAVNFSSINLSNVTAVIKNIKQISKEQQSKIWRVIESLHS